MNYLLVLMVLCAYAHAFLIRSSNRRAQTPTKLTMKLDNDAFRKANRAMRQAGADERTVELRLYVILPISLVFSLP